MNSQISLHDLECKNKELQIKLVEAKAKCNELKERIKDLEEKGNIALDNEKCVKFLSSLNYFQVQALMKYYKRNGQLSSYYQIKQPRVILEDHYLDMMSECENVDAEIKLQKSVCGLAK